MGVAPGRGEPAVWGRDGVSQHPQTGGKHLSKRGVQESCSWGRSAHPSPPSCTPRCVHAGARCRPGAQLGPQSPLVPTACRDEDGECFGLQWPPCPKQAGHSVTAQWALAVSRAGPHMRDGRWHSFSPGPMATMAAMSPKATHPLFLLQGDTIIFANKDSSRSNAGPCT